MPLKVVLATVALSQFVLGGLVLFLPGTFAAWIGLRIPPPDTGYLLAMLGARFVASGIGLVWLARQPVPDRFWVRNMAFIQTIDFVAGAVFLATGTIGLSTAAFPMFNAALFAGLLFFLSRPHEASTAI